MPRKPPLDEVAAVLREETRPLSLPVPQLPKVKLDWKGLRRTVVASDFHFPNSDPRVESILLQVIKDWRPHRFIGNGDLPDMNVISSHPKDLSETWGLKEERVAMHRFLFRLHEAMPKDAEILETNANHSGQGAESRWRRYLSERIRELASLEDLLDELHYARIFYPREKWSRIKLVDTSTITRGLIAIHGDIVRRDAGSSAKAMLEKYRVNLIHGHTHRMGSAGYRVPGVGGQGEHQMRAYEGGCMCTLSPTYTRTPNWQQGFCLVTSDDEGWFNVEQVLVHQGRAIVNATGNSYRA